MLRYVPLSLTLLRLALAPVVVAVAMSGGSATILAACLGAAFLSDVYDGVLARRLGVATAFLRRLDSFTDVVFYVAVFVAAGVTRPALVCAHAGGIALVVALEVAGQAVSFVRFRRPPGTHAYSAKVWGVLLFATSVAILCFGRGGMLFGFTVVVGIVAEVEVLAILLVSRMAPLDVRSVVHAVRGRGKAFGIPREQVPWALVRVEPHGSMAVGTRAATGSPP